MKGTLSMDNVSYKKLFDLKGKTAIVTGGTGILGKKFCSGLAEFGADIAIVDINEKEANDFAYKLSGNYGVKAIGIGCNVSSESEVDQMVQKVINEFGEINILLNNAATKSSELEKFFTPFEEYPLKIWREVMSVNIDGMFLIAQAVGKMMVSQNKGGSIIQTSSIYGIVGPDQRIYENSFYLGQKINTPAVYSVSKAAVNGLTRYLAAYWADKGIRVNTITPGGIESGQNELFIKNYSKRVPLGRMGNSEEIVGALIYLASDASSYVTGENIIIDGGFTVW